MPVRSLDRYMRRGLLVLKDSTSAQEAARAMHEREVGSVVVVGKNSNVTGIVTDRDLATQIIGYNYPVNTPISEFMTEDIFKITPEDKVEDAVNLMTKFGIRRIPIIKTGDVHGEKCVGIITLDDLIFYREIGLRDVGRIISKQILRTLNKRGSAIEIKRQERHEQALNRFYNIISKKTKMPRPKSDEISRCILRLIVQRLPPIGASQFLSQVPVIIQSELLKVSGGVNREITSGAILAEIRFKFKLSTKDAKGFIENFWRGIEEYTNHSGEPDHVLSQLPRDLRELLAV